jgi:hypothetical protein
MLTEHESMEWMNIYYQIRVDSITTNCFVCYKEKRFYLDSMIIIVRSDGSVLDRCLYSTNIALAMESGVVLDISHICAICWNSQRGEL